MSLYEFNRMFSFIDVGGVLSLVKRNKTPFIENCQCLTFDEVRPPLSLKKGKQLLSNFEDLNISRVA